MTATFADRIDTLASWRGAMAAHVREMTQLLRDQGLLEPAASDALTALQLRLGGEKMVVAFVAEFSRGKSELINAMFFADTGRRILPATPGRTTMCPVELAYDPAEPIALRLLPIETRLDSLPLAEQRLRPGAWHGTPLNVDDPDALAHALSQVTQTQQVPVEQARQLGFWDDATPDDNPPRDAGGLVEVPVWRHALINLPHPLLRRGLVVLDTPGLNAIGAEPELTVSLLPTAHATVFVLGADTGVTRSDLAIWRDHLSAPGIGRYAVLNKIDALIDPLSPQSLTASQIERQCGDVARTLQLPRERVFPLSAKQALAARVGGDAEALTTSRLQQLEDALAERLLPQQQGALAAAAVQAVSAAEAVVLRQLNDQRRLVSEQLQELRSLRGKNASKVSLMLQRVDAEAAEFEQCSARLLAMRSVHARMLKDALQALSSERLRSHVHTLQDSLRGSLLQFGAKKAFVALCTSLRGCLAAAQQHADEIRAMLAASFDALNGDHGFSLHAPPAPQLVRHVSELEQIERNYVQYLGLTQSFKLSQGRFLEQFRRMLVSRLRTVFDSASSEIDVWNRAASAQVDAQLRERRHNFKRRRDALLRIQLAAGDLEGRVAELTADDGHLQSVQRQLLATTQQIRRLAEPTAGPHAGAQDAAADVDLPLELDAVAAAH